MVAGLVAQPAHLRSGNGHAALPLTDPQLSLLTAFLGNKTIPICSPMCISMPPRRADCPRQTSGHDYGCASCHEIGGIKKPDNFAPELTRIAASRSRRFFSCRHDACDPGLHCRKNRQPRSFERVEDAAVHPRARANRCLDDSLAGAHRPRTRHAKSLDRAGETAFELPARGRAGQLMSDLACFSCHAINGRGGDMAPD